MQVLYERCCGLDVHKKSVTACFITPEGKEIQTFRTITDDIITLVDWIKSKGCSHVALENTGVSAKAMLRAIIDDAGNSVVIAKLAKGKLKNKQKELEKALLGLVGPHQKMILTAQLNHIEFLDQQIVELDQEIEARLHFLELELELLDSIPGVGRRTAEDILAEIGTEMHHFTSSAHLASWVGMFPGNNESVSKRKSGKQPKGNKSLRATLVLAARAAAKSKDTYLSGQYRRIAARGGGNRAAVAVGHSI